MRASALAIAWQFRWRHRWGFIALSGYLLMLILSRLLVLQRGKGISYSDAETFAFLVLVPLCATFMYFLAVFSFGLAGDLAARQSMYPTRMFTLPVTSFALAGWPMLYGSVAMFLLWGVTRVFALWPDEFDVPWIWPGVLASVLLAWTQALTWMPYPLPGMRVIVTVLWLVLIDAVVMVALEFKTTEPVMLAIIVPHIPFAFLVARYAVTRARRGEVPDWRRLFAWIAAITDFVPHKRNHFSSAESAQAWFEWRRSGRSMPAFVAIVLPFELALLFLFRDTPGIVFEILFAVLLTPPFISAFVAATVSKSNPQASDSYRVTDFIATRPLNSAALIAAKLKAAIRSTLAAWLLLLILVPPALKLSGTWTLVNDAAQDWIKVLGMPRMIAILTLAFLACLTSTWKQLVKSLYIGMSGREWLVKASVFLTLSFLVILFPLAYWIHKNAGLIATLWIAFPWIAAVLVCIKIFCALWSTRRLHDNGLISNRMLTLGAACWCIAVFVLYGLFVWIFPEMIIRGYILAFVAILYVPLARLSAAPLAFAWNRHKSSSLPFSVLPRNRTALAAVSVWILLPAVLAFTDAASFYKHNRNNGSLRSSGERREYLLYVPKSYDPSRATPLVISLHGAGGWPTQQMELSQWNRLAERQKFIVVYPSGAEGYGPRIWRVDRGLGLTKDVQFISDLIDQLESEYNIDPARIYANGLSNGGGMTFALSCTLSHRIAAVGMVASAQTLPWNWCTDRKPVPMIVFHGTGDPLMPYSGGTTWIDSGYFPSIPGWATKWARRNGCTNEPLETQIAVDVRLREYKNCAGNAPVQFYTIQDGGHTWPGGGPLPEWFAGRNTTTIDATRLMWSFFQQHTLHDAQIAQHP